MFTASLVLVILCSVVLTSFLSGIFGMVGGMVLMGIFGALLPVEVAMVLHGASQLTANGSRCLTLFRSVDWRSCGYYSFGALIGASLLWSVHFVPSRPLLFLLLGLMPFITLIKAIPKLRFEKPRDAVLAGIVVTAAHLTAGVSGPLLDLFFVHSERNRFQIIATKALTQSFGHLLKLFYFGAALQTAAIDSWLFIAIMVAAVSGTLLGGAVLRRMNDEKFRIYSRRIVLAMGTVYLAKAVWTVF